MSNAYMPQSNTASLPPPKDSVAVLPLWDAVLRSWLPPASRPHVAQTLPIKSASKNGISASALAGWDVPDNAALCLASGLRNQWQFYREQLRRCQKDFSETSVHQLRVATRRLMTHYILVDCVTSGDKAERARRKLKRRLKMLGQLRDTHVQRIFIEQHTPDFPELGLLRDALGQREQDLAGSF